MSGLTLPGHRLAFGLEAALTDKELALVHREAIRIRDSRRESQPITVRRFYHPNAFYTQPLPAHYVNDIIWSKAEFFKLDWVKRFTSNHEDEAGNRFVFKKMEVVLDDAYPDFNDNEIKCGCFAVFEAPNATERRFIGFAENEFSSDKFFEWFATTEEQNRWKIKRQILKARLADWQKTQDPKEGSECS